MSVFKKGDIFQIDLPSLAGLNFCIVDVVDRGSCHDLECAVLGDGRSPEWQLGVVYPFLVPGRYQHHIMSRSVFFQRFEQLPPPPPPCANSDLVSPA